ncbi:MAG: hypothetical protein P4L35_11290 [Ignavibacteriaceae bacterium]|nr:hypothetical protein [Ignavibacteriaceae bacterium]
MRWSYLSIIIILLSPFGLAKNIDSLKAKIISVENLLIEAKEELKTEQEKYPIFVIYGEIKDRDGDALTIWGSALPINNDYGLTGTVLEYNNITIINPDKAQIHYNSYSGGHHYYLGKIYSKNLFNVDVPVRWYGDLPQKDKIRLEELKQQVQSLKAQEVELSDKWNSIMYNNSFNEAKGYFKEKNYRGTINSLEKAKLYATSNSEINSLMFNTYVEFTNYYSNQKDYDNSLLVIKEAMLLLGLKPEQSEVFKKFYYNCSKEKAEENYSLKKYRKAIEYYQECVLYNKANIEQVKEKYAQSFIYLGDEDLNNGNIVEAKEEYTKAHEIDNSTTIQISEKLSPFKRSAFLYGAASIIPGLGQIIQGDSKNAITHFAIFGISFIGGIYLHNIANSGYNDYKNATSEADAVNQYDLANKKLNISNALFGLSGIVVIYSIIDSYLNIRNINKDYEINLNNYSYSTLREKNIYSLSFKLFF